MKFIKLILRITTFWGSRGAIRVVRREDPDGRLRGSFFGTDLIYWVVNYFCLISCPIDIMDRVESGAVILFVLTSRKID